MNCNQITNEIGIFTVDVELRKILNKLVERIHFEIDVVHFIQIITFSIDLKPEKLSTRNIIIFSTSLFITNEFLNLLGLTNILHNIKLNIKELKFKTNVEYYRSVGVLVTVM